MFTAIIVSIVICIVGGMTASKHRRFCVLREQEVRKLLQLPTAVPPPGAQAQTPAFMRLIQA